MLRLAARQSEDLVHPEQVTRHVQFPSCVGFSTQTSVRKTSGGSGHAAASGTPKRGPGACYVFFIALEPRVE